MAGEMNGLPPRAKNWNFIDLMGARQTVASGACPCGDGQPAAKKEREPKPSVRRRIGSRSGVSTQI